MHFDALTLACVVAELRQTLRGGRVQAVLMPDEQSIGLEVYAQRQRHNLLLTTGGAAARVHLVSQKLRRGVEQPTPLLQLLRKYVRDSLLETVEQPDPSERVLHLHFHHAEHGATTLVAELIGQRSNLLLLNPSGKILECLRRIWPGEGVTRPLLPGQPYTPPPPQNRLSPLDDGSADYYERLGALLKQDGKLWKVLTTHLAGISPTLGRELAWRAAGDSEATAQATDLMGLVEALQVLWLPVQTGDWQPGLWLEEGKSAGFSAYEAHFRGEFAPLASISAAVEQFYAQAQPGASGASPRDGYAALRATVAAELRRAQGRLERQLAALRADEPAPGAAETLRSQAEWLLALSSQVEPGQPTLEVELDDAVLSIPLDPHQTPVEQAEQMFHRAARLERAAKIIPERRVRLEADLEFLAQLSTDLALAENQPEIAMVREELAKTGLLVDRQKKSAKERVNPGTAQLRRYLSPQGFAIIVGRNARQNERVTFEIATGSDLWLHVRGAPGSHVVIRSGGQAVAEETLQMAAQLAAYYSSLRGERAAPVVYTERRFVSRAPGGRTGQVIVRNEAVITVRAELPEGLGDG